MRRSQLARLEHPYPHVKQPPVLQKGGYAALESTFLYRRLPVVSGEAERLGDELGRALKRILKEA